MNAEIKKQVIRRLETYPDRARQIALLHYELRHTARVSPEEVIGGMSLSRSDIIGGSGKGRVSNKTMYIALNYQEKTLLETREAEVIRLTFFEGLSQNRVAESLGVVSRTMRRIKKEAIEKLAEMYAFTENPMK